jgi:hypothetical protein
MRKHGAVTAMTKASIRGDHSATTNALRVLWLSPLMRPLARVQADRLLLDRGHDAATGASQLLVGFPDACSRNVVTGNGGSNSSLCSIDRGLLCGSCRSAPHIAAVVCECDALSSSNRDDTVGGTPVLRAVLIATSYAVVFRFVLGMPW